MVCSSVKNLNVQNYAQPNHEVSTHMVEDELIIFDNRSKQLARMNESATRIWKLHQKNTTVDEITQHFSDVYGMEKEKIFPDVVKALDEWQTMGLLGNDFIPLANEAEDVLGYMEEISLFSKYKKKLQKVKSYALLDSEFNIFVSNSEIKNILLPVIAHFPIGDSNLSHTIRIIEEKNSYVILDENKLVGRCNAIDEIVPIVNGHILVTSFLEVDCLSVFHAGVIYNNNDGVVLFSAGSGSGKSTLTAALMCTGKQIFSDEVAILTHDKKIRPSPSCIGLKKGSWDIIKQYYPSIFELATHHRQDDKVVKYLPPSSLPTTSQLKKGESVKAVIFPNYSPGHETALIPISAADALVKLTDAGYHTNQFLDHNAVTNLIGWIKEIPAYELSINDLREAVDLVETLL